MAPKDISKRLEFATTVARRAGELGRRHFADIDRLTVEIKGHQDLVSNADREVETTIREEIARHYPDDAIVGEEYGSNAGSSDHVWIIDPIDGTANFVRGIPAWCVVIACWSNGETVVGIVYEPMTDEMFAAGKGLGASLNGRSIRAATAANFAQGSVGTGFSNRRDARRVVPVISEIISRGGIFYRNASGALMLAYVAAGRLLGYCEEHMNSWDCAAGMLLVEEAGGSVHHPDPATFVKEGGLVVAAGQGIYDELAEIVENAFTA
jgi:myo-inositol-1(or 4)-monophosphatase